MRPNAQQKQRIQQLVEEMSTTRFLRFKPKGIQYDEFTNRLVIHWEDCAPNDIERSFVRWLVEQWAGLPWMPAHFIESNFIKWDNGHE